jgi:hypothetical protein
MPSPISTPPSALLPDPAWEGIRQTIQAVRAAGRAYLFGQAWLGWQLATLKKEYSIRRGQPKKNSAKLAEYLPWTEVVKAECGLSDRTADRFIQLFEATQAKLKRKVKGKKADAGTALALFKSENPLALPPEQREALQDIIASLCDGETQASLMQELGVVPKPQEMPKGGGPASKTDDLTAGQLAFHFFEAMVAPVINARTNPDYKKLLSALPAYSSEENAISLDTIATECRALLADIDEVQRKLAKPARGKVIR